MGDSVTNTKPWRSVLGALNEGGRSSGPISLRSAASSMSPSLRGDSDDDEEEEAKSNADVEEIDLGDGHVSDESEEGVEEEEVDGDGDGDVETPGAGWEDVSGELEAEFEQALMSEAEQDRANGNGMNGAVVETQRVVEESSEESEEE